MKDKIAECKHCKIEFSKNTRAQKFCSPECKRDNSRKPLEVCNQCGGGFKHKRNSSNMFCTKKCWAKWKSKHKQTDKEKEEIRLKKKMDNCFSTVHHNECTECESIFLSKRKKLHCSDDCRRKYDTRKARENDFKRKSSVKECIVCSDSFLGLPFTKCCSDECKDKIKKSNSHKHRHRAKKFKVYYESGITIDKIKKRDGNNCLICGCKTLEKNVSGYHKRNATIGHLTPLSKGGNHTMSNIQLECHECNTKLGATTHGQMRLM